MKTVTTHEAKTHLSRLLKDVHKGTTYIILSGKEPAAMLVPFSAQEIHRPQVGEATSPPVSYDEGTFSPLTDEELKTWGL